MAVYMGKDVAKLKAKGGGKWKYMSEKDMVSLFFLTWTAVSSNP